MVEAKEIYILEGANVFIQTTVFVYSNLYMSKSIKFNLLKMLILL